MFQTVPLSIIRSFSLYTQQWYMSYTFADSLQQHVLSWSCSQAVWHVPLLCVQWKTPDDGQRNCLKHVEFYFKNQFEKLLHLVGFTIRIYHDARSPERQILSQNLPEHTEETHEKCQRSQYPGQNLNWVIQKCKSEALQLESISLVHFLIYTVRG